MAVWPENAAAFTLFNSLATQWQHAGMAGVITGLQYEAIPVTARLLRLRLTPELFDDLRDMEAAALTVWREQAEREARRGGKR